MRFYSLVLMPRNRKEMEINRLFHCTDHIAIKNSPESESPLLFASSQQYWVLPRSISTSHKDFSATEDISI